MTVTEIHQVDLDAIVIAGRVRSDVGNVDSLAESIESVGLLNPLVVTPDHRLVAGERRLTALRKLGRKSAPCTVLDFDSVVKLAIAERDENTERVPFTREEQIRAAMRIEEGLKPAAAERQRASRSVAGKARHGIAPPACVQGRTDAESGKTQHLAAAAVGLGATSYYHGKSVLTALDEAPEELRPAIEEAVAEMNATGSVNTAAKKVREITGDAAPKRRGPQTQPGSSRHSTSWHRFDKAWGALTGACENAVLMPIPDDVTPDRINEMLRDLEGCITGINQLRKRLKGAQQ